MEAFKLQFQSLAGHPADCDDTRVGLLKIAALYTMKIYRKQSLPL
jgi:hypothetical protein